MRVHLGVAMVVTALALAVAAPAGAQQAPTLGAPPTPSVTAQPAFQSATICSRVVGSGISNSASRSRSGFSPSLVRNSRNRDRRLPATCFMTMARLFASGSTSVCRSASLTCAMALSPSVL